MDRVFCPYCGCGCMLSVHRNEKRTIEKTLPDTEDPVSQGKPCIKGIAVSEMISSNRLTTPLIRKSKREAFTPCTWKEAFSFIAENLNTLGKPAELSNDVYFVGSGECSNEANYLLSKLCRSHFSSNNIDSCARLCHAATGTAFKNMFGMTGIPKYSMDDLEDGDLFLFVGTDPMEDYPVMFNRVLAARNRGATLYTVDVAGSSTTAISDRFFQISPSGIIPLLSHLIVRAVDGGDISRDAPLMEGYALFVERAREIASQNPVSTFGFSHDDFNLLADALHNARKIVIGFGMGLTQHGNGTQNVYAISGLALLLNAVLFPNRGKVNIQGAGDVGADPFWKILEPTIGATHGWNLDFLNRTGTCSTESLYADDVNFVWIMGMNPSQSMPDLNALDMSLKNKFIVFQHHHPARTMEFADVVLPSLVLSEESGSVTNGERRVRGIFHNERWDEKLFYRDSTTEDSGARSSSEIIARFANFVDAKGFDFTSDRDVFNEMIAVVPGYSGVSFEAVTSLQGDFAQKNPDFIKLIPYRYEVEHFQSTKYQFVFTTARNRFQFCSASGTSQSKTLKGLAGEGVISMNPEDAQQLGINDGDTIKITSAAGNIVAPVKTDVSVTKRVLVAPFHFEKLLVNRLTPRFLDPESKTPCYKEIGVSVDRIE